MRPKLRLLKQYGYWSIIGDSFKKKCGKRTEYYVLAECVCGSKVDVKVNNLIQGASSSCGCKTSSRTHGLSKSPIYPSWNKMMQRCYNPQEMAYRYYGARGITVCPEWHKFDSFIAWGIHGWKKGLQIDRYPNNDGNYEPSNCIWSTPKENARRKRNVKLNMGFAKEIKYIHKSGFSMSMIAIAYGVSKRAIFDVVNNQTWV